MMVKCFANEQDDCGDQQVDVKGRPSKTPRESNLHQARHTPPPHYTPQPPPYYIPPPPHYTPLPTLYTIHTTSHLYDTSKGSCYQTLLLDGQGHGQNSVHLIKLIISYVMNNTYVVIKRKDQIKVWKAKAQKWRYCQKEIQISNESNLLHIVH